MSASITLADEPGLHYLLRIADTCLILAQRTAEWSGRAPVLEEDIALSNLGLDLIGQARALLSHVARLEGGGHDEDQLAFLREERHYRNVTLVELPRGDFAATVLRNTIMSTFLKALWSALRTSSDAEVAAIAAKALKEAAYHQRHAADWLVRLGDGTDESRQRVEAALQQLWRYTGELFDADAIDDAAHAAGLGPRWSELQGAWQAEMQTIFDEATLALPPPATYRSTGKRGVHSEHMGYLLAEMQQLQRAFPGGVW